MKSEKLLKHFIDDFDKYCTKKTSRVQKSTDNIIKLIYRDIKLTESWSNVCLKNDLITMDLKKISDSLKELPKSSLMDSSFMPGNIKDKILYNIRGYMKGSITLKKTKINVYYGLFKDVEKANYRKIKLDIIETLKYVKFMFLNVGLRQKVNSLDIYLYLTDEDKKMPKNPIMVLGPNNCNSAVTYACSSEGKILVYRREEWKKVLIHELFHSLCLDFSVSKHDRLKENIKKIFNVDSDFEISESYSEYWATVINCCFLSFKLLDDKNDEEDFLLFFDFCIQLERIFSLFQMNKVLSYMGLTYETLFKNDSASISYRKLLYKEDTNVLCYYVLKTILLFFNDDFLKWCLYNNGTIIKFDKTQQNFFNFYKFIKEKYNNKFFLNSILKMRNMNMEKKKLRNNIINLTARMTICEN